MEGNKLLLKTTKNKGVLFILAFVNFVSKMSSGLYKKQKFRDELAFCYTICQFIVIAKNKIGHRLDACSWQVERL